MALAWAILAGGLLQIPAATASSGSGDHVDSYWEVGGQILCFKVTNGGGKGIWGFHVSRLSGNNSSGSMTIAGNASSPTGWSGSVSPPNGADWTATGGSSIKAKASLAGFCVGVGGSGGMKLAWWTSDKSGATISVGDLDIHYP